MIKAAFAMASIVLFGGADALAQNRIAARAPTVEEETDFVWRTLRDIRFFEERRYQIGLPEDRLIDALKEKARANALSDADYAALSALMKSKIYQPADYQKGLQNVIARLPLVNQMLDLIEREDRRWRFKTFDVYPVTLTLYGPGGSYDPERGAIQIFTTAEGGFKNYTDPANTLIHEITHIGVQESIIEAYDVPHGLKERIVDTFVSLYFGAELPDYRIQAMGDARIDALLTSRADLANLGAIVERFMSDNR